VGAQIDDCRAPGYDDARSAITIDPRYRLGTVLDRDNGVRKAEIKSGWYVTSGPTAVEYHQGCTGHWDRPGRAFRTVNARHVVLIPPPGRRLTRYGSLSGRPAQSAPAGHSDHVQGCHYKE
jgi:hypothetical protein